MTDFESLLRLLALAQIEFIIVGGAAATVHGSSKLTQDLDIVFRRSSENLRRLAEALAPRHPYLRGARRDFRSGSIRKRSNAVSTSR